MLSRNRSSLHVAVVHSSRLCPQPACFSTCVPKTLDPTHSAVRDLQVVAGPWTEQPGCRRCESEPAPDLTSRACGEAGRDHLLQHWGSLPPGEASVAPITQQTLLRVPAGAAQNPACLYLPRRELRPLVKKRLHRTRKEALSASPTFILVQALEPRGGRGISRRGSLEAESRSVTCVLIRLTPCVCVPAHVLDGGTHGAGH